MQKNDKIIQELIFEIPELKKDKVQLEETLLILSQMKPKFKIDPGFQKQLKGRLDNITSLKTWGQKKYWLFFIPVFSFCFIIAGVWYYFSGTSFFHQWNLESGSLEVQKYIAEEIDMVDESLSILDEVLVQENIEVSQQDFQKESPWWVEGISQNNTQTAQELEIKIAWRVQENARTSLWQDFDYLGDWKWWEEKRWIWDEHEVNSELIDLFGNALINESMETQVSRELLEQSWFMYDNWWERVGGVMSIKNEISEFENFCYINEGVLTSQDGVGICTYKGTRCSEWNFWEWICQGQWYKEEQKEKKEELQK